MQKMIKSQYNRFSASTAESSSSSYVLLKSACNFQTNQDGTEFQNQIVSQTSFMYIMSFT